MKIVLWPHWLLGLVLVVGASLIHSAPPARSGPDQQMALAAVLMVEETGVEVQRANTAGWVGVEVETILSSGDRIRTDATGQANIDFTFIDLQLTIQPATQLEIVTFEEDADGQVRLVVSVSQGFIDQTLAESEQVTYTLRLPGLSATLGSPSTTHVRVEDDRRSALRVSAGQVTVSSGENNTELAAPLGVRAPAGGPLSELVTATDFGELDTKLDGCPVMLRAQGDFSLNVRLGPDASQPRIGVIDAENVPRLYGQTPDADWYRITFGGNFGWISGQVVAVTYQADCPALRDFEPDHSEDLSQFNLVGTSSSAVVITDTANVRVGPGTAYQRFDTVAFGTVLIVNGRTADGQWLRIYRSESRQLGWISAELVRLNTNLDALDVIPVDTLESPGGPDPAEDEVTPDDTDNASDADDTGAPTDDPTPTATVTPAAD